jgi:hypothetical protein
MKKNLRSAIRKIAVSLLFSSLFTLISVAQTITMPYLFNNNMVLQQNTQVSIWGWAAAGTTVYVKGSWAPSVTVTAVAGADTKWVAKLQTPVAVKGQAPAYVVTVSGPANSFTYSNVLIGEVWFCCGQSNMSFSMGPCGESATGVVNSAAEIAQANYPNIRLFRVPNANALTPQPNTTGGSWSACTPSSVTNFTAVGYYFGRQLYNNSALNVPVGLIENCYSGSAIQAWMKQDVLAADATLNQKYIVTPPKAADVNRVEMYPYKLYNAMMSPAINFTIKGVIWYQGESNASDGSTYTLANIAMLRDWRKDNGNNFSFYAVHMSPRATGSFYRAIFREAQGNIVSEPKTGIVAISDLLINNTELSNAHPTNKKDVGIRLGLMALAKDYGQNIIYQGPVYQSHTVSGNKATISFKPETLGSGLNTKDGSYVKCFKIAGSDQKFYPAMAVIKGNTVEVWSPSVNTPVAIRYAMADSAMTNLQNIEGLPVFLFRTDNWSSPTYIAGADPQPVIAAVDKTTIQNVSIYPNPCSNLLHISGLAIGNQRVDVYDSIGRKVKSQYGNELTNSVFDLSDVSSGAYSVKISQDETSYSCLKVLKQ